MRLERILFAVMGVLLLSSALALGTPTAARAQGPTPQILVQDYQAFKASGDNGTWVTKVTQLNPGDLIVLRFTVKANAAASGQVQVRFSGDTGKCMFFADSFTFNALESVSGAFPTVTLEGAPTSADFPEPENFGISKAEWVVTFNVQFDGAGEARIYHILQVSDQGTGCKGFSESRLESVTDSVKTRGSDRVLFWLN